MDHPVRPARLPFRPKECSSIWIFTDIAPADRGSADPRPRASLPDLAPASSTRAIPAPVAFARSTRRLPKYHAWNFRPSFFSALVCLISSRLSHWEPCFIHRPPASHSRLADHYQRRDHSHPAPRTATGKTLQNHL